MEPGWGDSRNKHCLGDALCSYFGNTLLCSSVISDYPTNILLFTTVFLHIFDIEKFGKRF
jgi:hypothetical protein